MSEGGHLRKVFQFGGTSKDKEDKGEDETGRNDSEKDVQNLGCLVAVTLIEPFEFQRVLLHYLIELIHICL